MRNPMSTLLLIPQLAARHDSAFETQTYPIINDGGRGITFDYPSTASRLASLPAVVSARFLRGDTEPGLTRSPGPPSDSPAAVTQNPRLLSRKSRACTRHNKQLLYVLARRCAGCNTRVKRVSWADERKMKDGNVVVLVLSSLYLRMLAVSSNLTYGTFAQHRVFHPILFFWLALLSDCRTDACHGVNPDFVTKDFVRKDKTISQDKHIIISQTFHHRPQ